MNEDRTMGISACNDCPLCFAMPDICNDEISYLCNWIDRHVDKWYMYSTYPKWCPALTGELTVRHIDAAALENIRQAERWVKDVLKE